MGAIPRVYVTDDSKTMNANWRKGSKAFYIGIIASEASEGKYAEASVIIAELQNGNYVTNTSIKVSGTVESFGSGWRIPQAVNLSGTADKYITATVTVKDSQGATGGYIAGSIESAPVYYLPQLPEEGRFRYMGSGYDVWISDGVRKEKPVVGEVSVTLVRKVGGLNILKAHTDWLPCNGSKVTVPESAFKTAPEVGETYEVAYKYRYDLPLNPPTYQNSEFSYQLVGGIESLITDKTVMVGDNLALKIHFGVFEPDTFTATIGDESYDIIEMDCEETVQNGNVFRLKWSKTIGSFPLDEPIKVTYYGENSKGEFAHFVKTYDPVPSNDRIFLSFGDEYTRHVRLEWGQAVSHTMTKTAFSEFAVASDRFPKAYSGVNASHSMTVTGRFDSRYGAQYAPLLIDDMFDLVHESDALMRLPHGRRYKVAVNSCSFPEGVGNELSNVSVACSEVQ